MGFKAKILSNWYDSAVGLVGAKKAHPVFFRTRFGIHTFFLNFPIDVLILDKNSRVIKLKENLKPNRIFLWKPKYQNVLELPSGSINKKKILIGMKINYSSS